MRIHRQYIETLRLYRWRPKSMLGRVKMREVFWIVTYGPSPKVTPTISALTARRGINVSPCKGLTPFLKFCIFGLAFVGKERR